jgi:hypothetical protein
LIIIFNVGNFGLSFKSAGMWSEVENTTVTWAWLILPLK